MTTIDDRTVTARKQHQCEECWKTIQLGERYHRFAGTWEGAFFTNTSNDPPPTRRRWVVVFEDKNSDIKLGKWFWTKWRAGAHLHRMANSPDVHEYFIVRLVDRKAHMSVEKRAPGTPDPKTHLLLPISREDVAILEVMAEDWAATPEQVVHFLIREPGLIEQTNREAAAEDAMQRSTWKPTPRLRLCVEAREDRCGRTEGDNA